MSNKKTTPSIFLSGGGDANQSKKLDSLFVRAVGKGKILYLPTAMKRDTVGYESCYDWVVSALTQHTDNFLDITMIIDLNDIKEEFLTNFRAIYIGGGNTYKLLDEIRKSGFDRMMTKFLRNGGIIYGGSAGAIIFGKDISTVSEEKDRNISTVGLSFINGYAIRCHFLEKDSNAIKTFVKNTLIPVIAIPEGSGLVISTISSRNKVIGENIKIFFPGQEQTIYSELSIIKKLALQFPL